MSNSTFTQCQACDQEVSARALKCSYCGELLRDFRECPHCAERIRASARSCRHCGQVLNPGFPVIRDVTPRATGATRERPDSYLAASTPLGALFCHRSLTGLVMAPELFVSPTDVELHSWSLFGLRSFDQRIPISRITSVRLVQGIFWGSIVIETYGGGPVAEIELRGMSKREAQILSRIIDEYVHAHQPSDESSRQQETV